MVGFAAKGPPTVRKMETVKHRVNVACAMPYGVNIQLELEIIVCSLVHGCVQCNFIHETISY